MQDTCMNPGLGPQSTLGSVEHIMKNVMPTTAHTLFIA
jgi:hypothetical protein